jgi:hypothetical protein
MASRDLIDEELVRIASLKAVEKVYVQALKAATPKKSSITSKRWYVKEKEPFFYEIYNDTATEDGKHSIVAILEFGTKKKYPIPKEGIMPKTPDGPKALHWQKGTKDFFAKKVTHPGFEGRFFVQKVMDDPELAERFESILYKEIARQLEMDE